MLDHFYMDKSLFSTNSNNCCIDPKDNKFHATPTSWTSLYLWTLVADPLVSLFWQNFCTVVFVMQIIVIIISSLN